MRKVLLLIALTSCMSTVKAQITVVTNDDFVTGDTCDHVRLKVSYDYSFVQDTTQTPFKPKHERMLLCIGDSVTRFVSIKSEQADSANAVTMKRGGNQYISGGEVSWQLYKGYPKQGNYALLDKMGTDRYVCIESYDAPKWTFIPDSTATILGYTCHLAQARYKGRNWKAWYADDIPVQEGPWKLSFLPGLVLRAYDDKGQFSFEANGLMRGKDSERIMYKGKNYDFIGRKDLEKLYIRYFADPIGYVTGGGNVKVEVRDEHGNPSKSKLAVPYNPIER